MPKYIEKKVVKNGIFKKAYTEQLNESDFSKKAKIRKEIDETVFDLNDSVADNAKWASILTIAISIIYQALSEETKGRMDPNQKAVMDALVHLYSESITRFEIQYAEEGLELITKMLDRQEAIGQIILKNKE